MDDRLSYLLGELRLTREARGKTQEDLAKLIGWSASTVAMVEKGQRKPSPGFWQRIDNALQTGGALERLATRISSPQWFIEWFTAENAAVALRSYQALVVPGLLQTEAYARAVLTDAGLTSAENVDRQVAARLARQAVLSRDDPLDLTAVLDEGVLHRPVGGPAVMRDQLEALVTASDLPHVRVHIVPSMVGAYAGVNGPFVIATASDRSETGYLDNQLAGQVVDGPADLADLARSWESVRSEALPHRQSVELIQEVAKKWI